jgi:transposase
MILTMRDKTKIDVISKVLDGAISVLEAGQILDRSGRQVFRMLNRVRDRGIEGLIHLGRGRTSPRRVKEQVRSRIISLVNGKYKGINDTHLKEILESEKGICIGRETLRAMLRRAGIAPKCRRRSPKYRGRRERKEAYGMMLQVDGSPHDWLEGRGPWITLVGGIDDATNHAWGRFEEAETTWAYMDLMREIITSVGVPMSLYSDRHSIFHALREQTIEEQLTNKLPRTQFGRAMDEIGVSILKAWTPQAKGRIERHWRTLQDRLVVDLRLADARTTQDANVVLERFLSQFNTRFTRAPKEATPVFRKAPGAQRLDRILCLKETRTVNNDHTISFEGLVLQIPPSKSFRSIAKQNVVVLQLRNGAVEIEYKGLTVARFSPEAVSRMVKNTCQGKTDLKVVA